MKLFITGVTGYIGQQLLLKALEKGYRVNALVRSTENCITHPGVRYFTGDVMNFDSIIDAMKGCDAVFHCAALTQFTHPDRSIFYRVNVGGTKNMLEAACYHEVRKFVFTSSCAVLGRSFNYPVCEDTPRFTAFENDYEISKYCAEELVKENSRKGLDAVIVSPSRVYGPGLPTKGNPISRLITNSIKNGVAIIPSEKSIVGNYVFIDDVVNGHFLALEKGLNGEKYILGGENISYEQFFRTIKINAGRKIKLLPVPKFLLQLGSAILLLLSRIFKRHTHLSPILVKRLFQNRAVCCDKAIRELKYTITPFTEGIFKTIQFLKTHNYV